MYGRKGVYRCLAVWVYGCVWTNGRMVYGGWSCLSVSISLILILSQGLYGSTHLPVSRAPSPALLAVIAMPRVYSSWSDIFALGLIVLECITQETIEVLALTPALALA